jgi:hypothetical protein
MGPPGKPYPFPGGKVSKLKKEKPGEKLGFPSVGMAESDNATAFSGQSPLKSLKEETIPSLQHNPGYPVKKEKVEPGQEPYQKNNKSRNAGLRNLEIRISLINRCLIWFVHLRYNPT